MKLNLLLACFAAVSIAHADESPMTVKIVGFTHSIPRPDSARVQVPLDRFIKELENGGLRVVGADQPSDYVLSEETVNCEQRKAYECQVKVKFERNMPDGSTKLLSEGRGSSSDPNQSMEYFVYFRAANQAFDNALFMNR